MRNDWPTARRSASPSSEHRALLVEGSARFPARRLLRVHYADGGMFAARCTYLEFLGQRFAPHSENEEAARQKELAECSLRGMPRTPAEMHRLLEIGGDTGNTPSNANQTELGL